MTDDWGNFGAPPKPPWRASKVLRSSETAASSAASSIGSADGRSSAPPASRSRRRPPPVRISSRLALQASAMACSTCVHAGIP